MAKLPLHIAWPMQRAANFVPCDLAEGRKSGWNRRGGGLSFSFVVGKTQTFCCVFMFN